MIRSDRSRLLVLVVLVVTAAELGVRVLADTLPPAPDWFPPEAARKQVVMERRADDLRGGMVALGSSVADAGIDPSLWTARTGQPAYNAALSAGSFAMIDAFERAEVSPTLDPSVVILTVSSRDLNANDRRQNRVERQWEGTTEAERILGRESLVDRLDRRLGNVSALWAHRQHLRTPRAWWGDAPVEWAPDRNLPDGQIVDFLNETLGTLTPEDERFFRTQILRRWTVAPQRVAALERTIDRLLAADRTVLLVDMPVSDVYLGLHPDPARDRDEYLAAVDGIVERTGVRLVRPGRWEAEWFADPIHLSGDGAARLTSLIVEQVGGLPETNG